MMNIASLCSKAGIAAIAVAGAVAASPAATAAPQHTGPGAGAGSGTVRIMDGCGWRGSSDAVYRHCDGGTGSHVWLDVEDIWGTIYNTCVGPGYTSLQPYYHWRITGAWWNGGICAG